MKTISDLQRAANRANAQKSTGPRTEAGKQRASLNALKHGGTAQTLILPGEDAADFARFHQSLRRSFQPANAHEESLVASLAQTQWVIDRMRAHELSIFALGHEQFAGAFDTGGDHTIQSALAGAKTVKSELDSLKAISLYQQRNGRMYESTLKQLLAVQATRKAEEKEQMADAVRIAQTHLKSPIPFHPAAYGFDFSTEEINVHLRRKFAPAAPPESPTTATSAA